MDSDQKSEQEEGASSAVEVTKDAIVEVLKTIEDPELFLDIWFLGLIYNIAIDDGQVVIDMTFTSPMCPAGPQLKHEVQTKVSALPGVTSTVVNITFQPPWEASDEVKGLLGMM
jgi:metal-sulfur cluster biosynthetic enzyme